jgi:hypothetical protein
MLLEQEVYASQRQKLPASQPRSYTLPPQEASRFLSTELQICIDAM